MRLFRVRNMPGSSGTQSLPKEPAPEEAEGALSTESQVYVLAAHPRGRGGVETKSPRRPGGFLCLWRRGCLLRASSLCLLAPCRWR